MTTRGYRRHSYGDLCPEPSARPGRRVKLQRPVERGDAVGEAPQTRSAARIRPADAVVAHLDHGVPVARGAPRTVAWLASAYLTTLVSASATTK